MSEVGEVATAPAALFAARCPGCSAANNLFRTEQILRHAHMVFVLLDIDAWPQP